jgi:hypothetical protein
MPYLNSDSRATKFGATPNPPDNEVSEAGIHFSERDSQGRPVPLTVKHLAPEYADRLATESLRLAGKQACRSG